MFTSYDVRIARLASSHTQRAYKAYGVGQPFFGQDLNLPQQHREDGDRAFASGRRLAGSYRTAETAVPGGKHSEAGQGMGCFLGPLLGPFWTEDKTKSNASTKG